MATNKDLQLIKGADADKLPFDKGIFKEMQRIIGDKTDGFSNPGGLDTKKVDMTEDIENAQKDPAKFKEKYGSTKYSEVDIVEYLAGVISGNVKPPKDESPAQTSTPPKPSADADKAKKLKLIKIHSNARKRAMLFKG